MIDIKASQFKIMSDLHLDRYIGLIKHHPLLDKVSGSEDTILIIAGDLVDNLGMSDELFSKQPLQQKIWEEFIAKVSRMYALVICVMGNHDYFYSNIHTAAGLVKDKIRSMHLNNVILLDDEKIDVCGYTIIGSTLWTSFNNDDPKVREMAEQMKPDYRKIYGNQGKLTVDEIYKINKDAKLFLNEAISSSSNDTIVITHNAPCFKSIDDRFKSNLDINFLYYEDMSPTINRNTDKLKLWVHGHTHQFNDYPIKKTRVVCNPYGNGNHDNVKIGFVPDFRIPMSEL